MTRDSPDGISPEYDQFLVFGLEARLASFESPRRFAPWSLQSDGLLT